MQYSNLLLMPAALIAALLLVSCTSEAPDSGDEGLRLVMLKSESLCDENEDNLGHEDFELPLETATVVVRVKNSEHETVERVEAATILSGRVMLTSIPPGDYTVDVALCNSAEQARWVGTSPGVTVTANTKTFPSVLLAPVGFGACTNLTGSIEGAGFVSSTADETGTYLIGGVKSFQLVGASGTGTGSAQIRKYSSLDGTVREIGDLDEPRFGAWAVMNGDSIRLFGGATTLNLGQIGTNPLSASGIPTCPVVDIDAQTGAQTCVAPTASVPAWPAIARTESRLVAVGGLNADGSRSNEVFFLEGDTLTSNTLPSARFGSVVVGLEGDTTFVLGGNTDDVANTALLILNNDGISPLAYGGAPDSAPSTIPYLAAGHYLGRVGGRDAVVVVGGHELTPPSSLSVVSSKQVSLVLIDGTAGVWERKSLDVGSYASLFERSAAQIVELDGGDLVLLGGFTSTATHPDGADACEGQNDRCFRTSMVRFRINPSTESIDIIDDSLSLGVGAFGARGTVMQDGAMLVTSGMEDLGGGDLPERSELLRFASDLDNLCAP